ncbi:MAG: NAD(P)-dependent oxidoreductase [Nostoc sp.]|uniref:NAD(P)-dependent oxidoreductase n=1 Tax=Nostoc sp. TaxID=1180 RepID=UPI002FF940B3
MLYRQNVTEKEALPSTIQELTDATLLIIGAGGIGQEIAARAKPFGLIIIGSRRHPQELPNFDQVVGADEWRSLPPCKQRSIALFIDNLKRYQAGKPLRNVVDKEAGY